MSRMTGPYRSTDLLRLAEIYAAAKGLRLTRVGRQAVGTHHLFARLARGEGCTLRTAQRAYEFFYENWPTDLYWPADIPRALTPAPRKAAPAKCAAAVMIAFCLVQMGAGPNEAVAADSLTVSATPQCDPVTVPHLEAKKRRPRQHRQRPLKNLSISQLPRGPLHDLATPFIYGSAI